MLISLVLVERQSFLRLSRGQSWEAPTVNFHRLHALANLAGPSLHLAWLCDGSVAVPEMHREAP